MLIVSWEVYASATDLELGDLIIFIRFLTQGRFHRRVAQWIECAQYTENGTAKVRGSTPLPPTI